MANAGITGTFATETLPALNNMAYSVIYNPLSVDIFYNQALAGLPPPVQTEINLAENQLGLIGVDTPWLVLSGEGAAQDPIVVCATDLSLLIAGLGEESEGGLNSLFGNLTDLARLQGWNDESRLVCR
jgi:hypothetical protein